VKYKRQLLPFHVVDKYSISAICHIIYMHNNEISSLILSLNCAMIIAVCHGIIFAIRVIVYFVAIVRLVIFGTFYSCVVNILDA